MSFFMRKRQKTAVVKKKWEVSDSDEDSDSQDPGEEGGQGNNMDGEGGDFGEMICRNCNGERDADLFCKDCKLYFCVVCFADTHKKKHKDPVSASSSTDGDGKVAAEASAKEGGGDTKADGSSRSSSKEEGGEGDTKADGNAVTAAPTTVDDDKSLHKIRRLVGGKSLAALEVGWIEGEEKSQVMKKAERDAEKARKEAEEKAKREAAERERKEKELQAANAKKAAMEAANAARMAAINAAAARAAAAHQAAVASGQYGGIPVPPQQPQTTKRHVFISNIPFEAKLSDVRTVFKQCGRIVDANMPKNNMRKRPMPGAMMQQQQAPHRGICFMEFDSEEGAQAAVKLDGTLLYYRPIRVALDVLGHTRNQPYRPTGVPYKRKMCIYFQQGKCVRGEQCSFAHHPREIQANANAFLPKQMPGVVDGGFQWQPFAGTR
mmetsp:Transcript_440/g.582  ORF Transcript_440/g.582 Transcript_440/m.582 type:complete len:435 (+) Transcript_440:400-1704(+)|eukprot:jgi/Bigna1/80703/fgenesh1_pg.73_\